MEIKEIFDKEEKKETASAILSQLIPWFEVPEARQAYIEGVAPLPFFQSSQGGEPIGFLAFKENSPACLEIYVMGVLPHCQRQGAGRGLIQAVSRYGKERGFSLLEVKTLAASHPDPYYAGSRAFYRAMGFQELDCLPEIWGEENPCLIMVKPLDTNKDR